MKQRALPHCAGYLLRRYIGTPEQHMAALRIANGYARKIPSHLTPDVENAALMGLWQALQANQESNIPYLRARVRGAVVDRLRELDILSRKHRKEVTAEAVEFKRVGEDALRDVPFAWDVERGLDQIRAARNLMAAVDTLKPRLKFVIRGHLQGKSQRSMGVELGVSEPRINQLVKEAVFKIREQLFGRREQCRQVLRSIE